MAGPAYPLQENVYRARRTDVAHQIDVTDIDAKLEGRGGDNYRQFTRLKLLFDLKAGFPR